MFYFCLLLRSKFVQLVFFFSAVQRSINHLWFSNWFLAGHFGLWPKFFHTFPLNFDIARRTSATDSFNFAKFDKTTQRLADCPKRHVGSFHNLAGSRFFNTREILPNLILFRRKRIFNFLCLQIRKSLGSLLLHNGKKEIEPRRNGVVIGLECLLRFTERDIIFVLAAFDDLLV